jgi:predicted branched-subunit amino acid permease
LQNPKSLGLDMVLGCFLLAMALGGKQSPRVLVAWTVAALASLAAWKWLPPNTHVVVGALAGGAIGFFWLERKPAADVAGEANVDGNAHDH